MKDVKEVILDLEDNSSYEQILVANEIYKRYKDLNTPLVLPDNDNNKKSPKFVFNTNPDFQMTGNAYSISIVVTEKYFDKLLGIIFDVIDIFSDIKIEFKRIGLLVSNFYSDENIEKAKSIYLNEKALPSDVSEINLSWYVLLHNKYSDINAWERIITDTKSFKDLLIQYDFNTPYDAKIKLDMKFLKEFFNTIDNYIEERTKI